MASLIGAAAVGHSDPGTAGATDTLVFDVFGPDGLYLPNVRLLVQTELQVGIDAVRRPLSLTLYPNPVRDVLTVEVAGVVSVERVRLLDVAGRVVRVLAQAGASGSVQLDVSGLAAGYYFVEVAAEGGRASLGVVVE